jgi:hypothetical protein
MNLHQRDKHCETVDCSAGNPRENRNGSEGYWVRFGMRAVVWCKSHYFESVQNAGVVLDMGGHDNGGV